MYESGLGFSDGYITGYNSSAISAERANYAKSATSANGAISSQTANYVVSGWEKSDNKITAYNGTAFSASGNPQIPISGESGVYLTRRDATVFIGFSGAIFPASADAVCQGVKTHSANWGDIPTKVVDNISNATAQNVLYIVTG